MDTPNFEQDVLIDHQALEVEWIMQPKLALEYSKYLTYLNDVLRRAEEKVKLVRSELVNKAHRDPNKHLGAGNKPTAPLVEAFYRTNKKYVAAKEEWLKAMEEQEYGAFARNEIAFTRKTELENLVKLHGQNYFSSPHVPRDLDASMQARLSNTSINKQMKEKEKKNKKKKKK